MTATLKQKALKPRTCKAKGCANKFTPSPFNTLETWCSTKCGYALSQENIAKKAEKVRLERKRGRIAAKKEFNERDKSWCCAKAKDELHRWIKYVRDVDKPCISCGNANPDIKYDAGHFLSVGAHKNLEMEPRNIHKQCSSDPAYCLAS